MNAASTERLDALRTDVEAILTERRTIEEAPLSRDEVVANVERFIVEQAEKVGIHARDFTRSWSQPARIAAPLVSDNPDTAGSDSSNVAPALCWLAPERVLERVMGELDQSTSYGPKRAAREKKLAELGAKLFDAELAEEDEVVRLIGLGMTVSRRVDIENVLALVTRRAGDTATEAAAA